MIRAYLTAVALLLLAACGGRPRASTPHPAPPSPQAPSDGPRPAQGVIDYPTPPNVTPAPPSLASSGLREVFPYVRVDTAAGVVEIDATVPIDAHSTTTPRVYLEVVLCTADTKEHEALVMTRATPSNVHAALLLAGLEPGAPGAWDWEGAVVRAIPPTGPALDVRLIDKATGRESSPAAWVVSAKDGRTLADAEPTEGFVFAGSQMVRVGGATRYRADAEGCIIGLTTFGGEVVAWTRPHNPDSAMEEPVWIASGAAVPARGTPITVRISRAR